MSISELTFEHNDHLKFREFLNLDEKSVTWQNKNQKDFDDFWNMFFVEGLSLPQISDRFKYLEGRKVQGPLASWYKWLANMFYTYVFINYDISLSELATLSSRSISDLSMRLTNNLIDLYRDKRLEISKELNINTIIDKKIHIKFSDLVEKFDLPKDTSMSQSNLKHALELTLFSDWKDVNKKIKKDFFSEEFNFEQLREKASFRKQLFLARDILLYFLLGIALIFAVKYGNQIYEKHILDKISVLENQLSWQGQTLSFKSKTNNNPVIEQSAPVDISNFGEDPFKDSSIKDSKDFSVESNVSLTSWGDLPKNLDSAEGEVSEYEEVKTRGYRAVRYGRTKVFRVMMRTSNPDFSNQKS